MWNLVIRATRYVGSGDAKGYASPDRVYLIDVYLNGNRTGSVPARGID
jgi:hypothetical protein